MILLPTASNQTKSGSVSVLEPDPSDKGDLDVISCRASDVARKTESSGKEGSRREIRSGMRGVKSLTTYQYQRIEEKVGKVDLLSP